MVLRFYDFLIFRSIHFIYSFFKPYKTTFRRKLFKKIFKKRNINTKSNVDLDSSININQLISQGFIKFKISDLENKDLIDKINSSIYDAINLNKLNTSNNLGSKKYLQNLLDPKINPDIFNKLLKIFTHSKFTNIIENYLNEDCKLTSIKILKSPENSEYLSGSQLFHCDHDDTKMIKIFIHVNDINLENGPLEVISKDQSSEIKNEINYRWGGKEGHIKDNFFERKKVSYHSLTGDSGTIILADTAQCFHRGSRNPKKHRLVIFASYCTRTHFASLYKFSKNKNSYRWHSPMASFSSLLSSDKKKYL